MKVMKELVKLMNYIKIDNPESEWTVELDTIDNEDRETGQIYYINYMVFSAAYGGNRKVMLRLNYEKRNMSYDVWEFRDDGSNGGDFNTVQDFIDFNEEQKRLGD